MIITRIQGGLGNQMFQYAIARSLALKNNDQLKLDDSFFLTQTLREYQLNQFNIIEDFASKSEIYKLRGIEGFIYKIFKKLGFKYSRPSSYIEDKSSTIYQEEIFNLRKDDIYLSGFWQNEKYFSSIKKSIVDDFMPKNEISETATKYLEKIKNSNSISLHVRRGDYVNDANATHGLCDINYYKRALNFIKKNIKNANVFIFSDDITWCKNEFAFLKDSYFIHDTKSEVEDLTLMKNCKHNIIANSTFSWWGAWLNQNPDKVIITPKYWYARNDWKNKHPAPSNWLRM